MPARVEEAWLLEVQTLLARTPELVITTYAHTIFAEGNRPVALVTPTPEILTLHEELVSLSLRHGAVFNTIYQNENYTPHLSYSEGGSYVVDELHVSRHGGSLGVAIETIAELLLSKV